MYRQIFDPAFYLEPKAQSCNSLDKKCSGTISYCDDNKYKISLSNLNFLKRNYEIATCQRSYFSRAEKEYIKNQYKNWYNDYTIPKKIFNYLIEKFK